MLPVQSIRATTRYDLSFMLCRLPQQVGSKEASDADTGSMAHHLALVGLRDLVLSSTFLSPAQLRTLINTGLQGNISIKKVMRPSS